MSEFICGDCMEYLPKFADGEFDLAITDPPYGGGFTADAADSFGSKRGRFGGVFDRYFENDAGGGGRVDAYLKHQGFSDGRHVGDEVPDERGYL